MPGLNLKSATRTTYKVYARFHEHFGYQMDYLGNWNISSFVGLRSQKPFIWFAQNRTNPELVYRAPTKTSLLELLHRVDKQQKKK